jgi:serine O-acetyltransferase
MFEYIREDLRRFHFVDNSQDGRQSFQVPSWNRRIEEVRIFWRNPSLKALVAYRLGRWLSTALRFPLWWPALVILAPAYWLLRLYFRAAYDICLERSADIGPGLYIGHFGGIRIRNCRLGANCAIQQEVQIGPTLEGNVGPTIGDRVWIGAHARIEGPITVGDRATIAAGARINSDVSEGCLMLGNPARVYQQDYDNSAFL